MIKRKHNGKNHNDLPIQGVALYTASMSIFPAVTPAPQPRTKESAYISIFYAVLLVIMAVTQLFTFEEVLVLFGSLGLPGGLATGYGLAATVVAAEVFAVPFLLRMSLSPAFRWFSLLCGLFVGVAWLFIASWIVLSGAPVQTVGFVGTLIDTIPGWWAVLVSVAILMLAIWSAWGMWPSAKKHKK